MYFYNDLNMHVSIDYNRDFNIDFNMDLDMYSNMDFNIDFNRDAEKKFDMYFEMHFHVGPCQCARIHGREDSGRRTESGGQRSKEAEVVAEDER